MTQWSVADVLDRLAPASDAALTDAARARVHTLAAHLPAALTRVVYLESWVGQLRPRLDLIVKVDPGDREALVEFVSGSLPPALRALPAWQSVARFAQAWAAAEGPLHQALRAAWLELDLDPSVDVEAALEAPRIFVDFTREVQRGASLEARVALACEVVRVLAGACEPALAASLRRALALLPEGGALTYIGVFPREGQPPIVRLCLLGLAGAKLASYLGAIGWPGEVGALQRRVLEPLAFGQGEGCQPVGVVHLDLLPEVGPRIGLEYTFPRPGLTVGLRAPDAFLRQLVALGWCTPPNREALRAWPRRSVELMPHDVWHSRVTREIGHVKLTYAPGALVVAKAYLRSAFELQAGGALLRGRPRGFGASAPGKGLSEAANGANGADGAPAPSDGGGPPFAPARRQGAAPQVTDGPVVRARGLDGTGVASVRREPRREMAMSTNQQEALEQILSRSAVDPEFRQALLVDPRKAILDALGVRIPANFRVKFIEREKNLDALIVLPELQRADGELDDDDLEAVAGGTNGEPDPVW